MRYGLLELFAGVFAVLLFASLVGRVLSRRVAAGAPSAAIEELNARIRSWWWMAVLLGIAFAFGRGGVVVLFTFVSFLCLREFVSLTYTRRTDHWALALAFFFFLPLQYVLVAGGWYGLYAILIPVYGFLTMPAFAALSSDTARYFERASTIQAALMICVYCISYVPALMTLRIPGYENTGLLLIAWLVLVVQTSDVLQQVWGRFFGKRPIAPALTPAKTLEGVVGGAASASVLGAMLAWLTPFTVPQAAGIAAVCGVMGLFGSFTVLAVKRDRGVRDWGTLIERRGSMLDRLDSVIFAAPVYFHILRYGWQG
jgi:phosphatidate cytidylyltransferase